MIDNVPEWVMKHITEVSDGSWQAWDETQSKSLGVYPELGQAIDAILIRAEYIERLAECGY